MDRHPPRGTWILKRIHDLAFWRKVQFTHKASRELAELRLDRVDAREVIAGLTREHFVGRLISHHSGEWLYAFRVEIAGLQIYVKMLVRDECVVVSFHEESEPDVNEEQK